jgi:hypothetical protein
MELRRGLPAVQSPVSRPGARDADGERRSTRKCRAQLRQYDQRSRGMRALSTKTRLERRNGGIESCDRQNQQRAMIPLEQLKQNPASFAAQHRQSKLTGECQQGRPPVPRNQGENSFPKPRKVSLTPTTNLKSGRWDLNPRVPAWKATAEHYRRRALKIRQFCQMGTINTALSPPAGCDRCCYQSSNCVRPSASLLAASCERFAVSSSNLRPNCNSETAETIRGRKASESLNQMRARGRHVLTRLLGSRMRGGSPRTVFKTIRLAFKGRHLRSQDRAGRTFSSRILRSRSTPPSVEFEQR